MVFLSFEKNLEKSVDKMKEGCYTLNVNKNYSYLGGK